MPSIIPRVQNEVNHFSSSFCSPHGFSTGKWAAAIHP